MSRAAWSEASARGGRRSRERYWATTTGQELADEMTSRIDAFYLYVQDSGHLARWRESAALFRSIDRAASGVEFAGEQGELMDVAVNHYRSILRGVHALVTGTRPALNARAMNPSSEAAEEAMLFQSILEYDMNHRRLEWVMRRVMLHSLLYAEGHAYQYWDFHAGAEYAANENGMAAMREGDVRTVVLSPLDVIRDPQAIMNGDDDPDWRIVRRRVKRWDLIARYCQPLAANDNAEPLPFAEPANDNGMAEPELDEETRQLRDHILGLDPVDQDQERLLEVGPQRGAVEHDYVYVFELVHKPSLALPQGAFVAMAGGKLLTPATGLPYGHMPVHTLMPDPHEERPFGYSSSFDLIGLQRSMDSLWSAAHTNLDAGAINNFWTRTGDTLKTRELAGGMRHLQSREKPELIQFGRVTEDTTNIMEMDQRAMETLIGLNSVARGDPESNLRSGAALALVQSMAIQFASEDQAAYGQFVESLVNGRLELYKKFAATERIVDIAGESHAHPAVQWTRDSISQVAKVNVELSNPIMQTSEGRLEMADKFAANGWITTPEQYVMVLATGRADPILKRDRNEMRLIAVEVDAMRKAAKDPQIRAIVEQAAAMGDDTAIEQIVMEVAPVIAPYHRHVLHTREQSGELNSPSAFDDAVFAHLLRVHLGLHENARRQLVAEDPAQLERMGEPPTELEMQAAAMEAQAQMAAQGGPPGGPMPPDGGGAPPPEGGPPPGGGGEPPAEEPPPRAEVPVLDNPMGGGNARMPLMPVNPLTEERADPLGGGE